MAEEDNYLPTNPKPSAPKQNKPAQTLKVEPLKRQETPAAFERIRNATENKPRREFIQEKTSMQPEVLSEDQPDALLQTLDISQPDELKKAIIYSEILRPKF
jgi:hypothetical protein